MNEFTITEDFPKSEIEFDLRFLNPSACYDYLFSIKWPNGFVCKKFMRIVQQVVKSSKIKCNQIKWDIDPISELFSLELCG